MYSIYLNLVLLVYIHPEVKNWIKYARFEEKNNYINSARRVYERAVEFFGQDNIDENLLIAFAKFEEVQREVSRISSLFFSLLFSVENSEHFILFFPLNKKNFENLTKIVNHFSEKINYY